MTVKKIIGKLHLWLGLASGLLVFIIATTGCILAFEAEIKNLTYSFLSVPAADKPILPPSVLIEKAEQALPGKKASGMLYQGKGKSTAVGFYNPDPEYYYLVYMNPYSGEVLNIRDEDQDFFHIILHGHYYLWLPEKIGQPIVASATLIFFVMLISGLVLWWPKNKKVSRQRFSIKWNAKWRRVNYDLHHVVGFYVLVFGLVFAITGLVWGFQWFSNALYTATGGSQSTVFHIPDSESKVTDNQDNTVPMVDRLWQKLVAKSSENAMQYMYFPATDSSSYYTYINRKPGTYYQSEYGYYDRYTLEEIQVENLYQGTFEEADFAGKLRRMNYDIHVGAILGLPGKVLAFFASLICASLPVTGFVIWWGRRNKKKGKSKTREMAVQRRKPEEKTKKQEWPVSEKIPN